MQSAHRWLGAAALVFALAGCNGEVVVGGQKDVDAYATGDGTSGGGSASLVPAYARAPGGPVTTHLGGSLAGTVTFQARVELVDAAGDAVALAPSPAGATVRLDGHEDVCRSPRLAVRALPGGAFVSRPNPDDPAIWSDGALTLGEGKENASSCWGTRNPDRSSCATRSW